MPVAVSSLRGRTHLSDTNINLCVIIPVYNHPDKLHQLTTTFNEINLPIIMVDDGSDASCQDILMQLAQENAHMTLQTHSSNQGKGAAIKTGIHAAQKAGFTHALQIDADGQHDTNDVTRFIEAMHLQPDALIAGYPQYDESIPKLRYYGRYASHVWVWINTLSMTIKDSMCGFRIYPVARSQQLIVEESIGDRMDYDGEFIVRWYWDGQPLMQIPTRVIYPEHGVSHFRLFKDNCLISWMHARLFFGMLCRLPQLLERRWKAP